ncbi:phosphotransferase [Brevibacterium spongiae]|uniref:Phosphotransferase n=1 Tax=Brevibacterium spongiae TaxID=2909672 RepID=A0ABY5SPR4_9MICO|nr:phosphotransferase [Brevibacterium spongiae]UVI35116.1 phosphotransferase [Brevibacterium spongiae]
MLPDGLSMLWENDDSAAALTDRFGFRDLRHAESWLRETLRDVWDIDIDRCTRIAISDHNAIGWVTTRRHDRLVVKWSMETGLFDRLHATTTVLSHLSETGAPVAPPVHNRDGSVRTVVDGPRCPLSVAVLPELAGQWLDTTDLDAVAAAGRALAELHNRLGEVIDVPAPLARGEVPRRSAVGVSAAEPEDMRGRIRSWLAQGGESLAPQASAALADLLESAPALEDAPQLIHRDFRAANILVEGCAVTAILDFDEMTVDHRIRDLAQASVYLGTLFHDWAPTERAAQIALCEGYESVRPLGLAESVWFPIILLWQSIAAVGAQGGAPGWVDAADALAEELTPER